MLKRYKNAFVQTIQAAGLDIDDFTAMDDDIASLAIRYKPIHLVFTAFNDPEDPHAFSCSYTIYAPGFDPPPNYYPERGFVAFKYIREAFERWLAGEVRIAIDEELLPDLWAMIPKGLAKIESDPISPVAEFTEEERQQLKLALSTFRLRLIETFNPDEEQLKVISQKVDYLVAAVDRLKKFDWKGVAISTLIGISTTLSLDTQRGRQLYGLFQQALSGLFHLLR